jgi:hypothetical protein
VDDGRPLSLLPDAILARDGPVTRAFLDCGVRQLRAAAGIVWKLPYGRNRSPADALCVLREGRGTCSTKHPLLARLLAEQGIEGFELRLGIYDMDEANTPGVGGVLARYGLRSIPEAHCYLAAGPRRLDFTRALPAEVAPITRFVQEVSVEPGDVSEFKPALHRRYLEEYAAAHPGLGRSAGSSGRYGSSASPPSPGSRQFMHWSATHVPAPRRLPSR